MELETSDYSDLQQLIARRRLFLLELLGQQPDPVPMLVIAGGGNRRWPTGRPSMRTIGTDVTMLRHAGLVSATGQTKGRVYQLTDSGRALLQQPKRQQGVTLLELAARHRRGELDAEL